MIMKHINKYIFASATLIAFASAFSSCKNEEDDIFDASAAERLEQAKTENHNLLCAAPNGWAMQYFADNTDEGGYTFLMKFDKNTSVKIAANSSLTGNVYKEETSMFDVIADYGPVLTFNSYNSIFHQLADPYDVPSLPGDESGYGHRGDYEFIIMDATADRIELRGKKHGVDIIMTALPEDADWATYFDDLKAKSRSLFNDKFDPLLLDLGDDNRFIVSKASTGVFNIYPEGGDAISQTTKHPYVINNNGIRFKEKFEDTEIQELLFSEDGTLHVEGIEGAGLRQSLALNEIFARKSFSWRITTANCYGSFSTVLAAIETETKDKLKRNFNSIDLTYYSNQSTYVLSFRNSGTSAAAYIYGDETVDADGVSVKFDFSTTEGNNNGKNRLRDIPSLTTFINLLNSTQFTLSTDNPLAPTTVTLKSKDNENDYMIVPLV